MPDDDPRSDWHEQDLLTNSEADERLVAEGAESRDQLAGMAADDPRRPLLERRIEAIDEALRQIRAR
ncbi:hypothetical protein GCM10009547_01490 [Sporichthya brevicatena]|uniref:Uncharacterized protein n=1 Tax=Sporichthya brevicatena TaxID=171442 RepID=A0ABN1G3W2_9ACTN